MSFASEPNALLLPDRPDDIDRASVAWYFSQKTTPGDRSADDRIRKLPAGCYLKIDAENRIETKRYWSIRAQPRTPVPSDEDATRELESLLTDAVRLRMRADVEVGSYLSGGVDSSLGVALASRCTPRPRRRTASSTTRRSGTSRAIDASRGSIRSATGQTTTRNR